MWAVFAGRGGRRDYRGGCVPVTAQRFMYTGSHMDSDCSGYRCCSLVALVLSGMSGLGGVMLTVFGSTGFFQTLEQNNMYIIIGVGLLILALLFLAIGLFLNRRAPERMQSLSSRIPEPEW